MNSGIIAVLISMPLLFAPPNLAQTPSSGAYDFYWEYPYDIDLWQTGIRIDKGHRLRVVVCSTLFPDTDRNLNTGEPVFNANRMVVASQKIYHDPKRASYVELAVVSSISGWSQHENFVKPWCSRVKNS